MRGREGHRVSTLPMDVQQEGSTGIIPSVMVDLENQDYKQAMIHLGKVNWYSESLVTISDLICIDPFLFKYRAITAEP